MMASTSPETWDALGIRQAMKAFRNAIVRPSSPEKNALLVVQEAINPQKQTILVLDENQTLENALRTLLQDIVSAAAKSGERTMQYGELIGGEDNNCGYVPRLLDIVLFLCEKGHIEGGMIFQLLEDLTEMSTMRDCKEVFGYIESKQDTLGKQELFGRGKLVMLRTCNQLLRRLSKANDVVFCGRILMFLAHFFPLSERSAVNFKGIFNISNETKYEKDASEGASIDLNFYKIFWSLQEHFRNPAATTLPPAKWQKFSSNLMIVLDAFDAQPLYDDGGNINNLEQEEASFSIKYLTSSKLMGLELKDPSFRRHILVQCLVVFDYLKAPTKSEKDWPSDTMKEEIKSLEQRVKILLESIPPKGKEFLQSIEHILEREKNWLWWKWEGCPPFEKQPAEKKTGQDVAKRRKPRWRLGNKELSQLWKWAEQNPNALSDPQRVHMPSVSEYWKPLAEDMDPAAGIDEEYHHKNNRVYCWKGLRFSARQDLEGFSKFSEHGIEGVVPPELLPAEVSLRFHLKPSDKNKRVKREEESRNAAAQPEEGQIIQASTTGVDAEGGGSSAELDDNGVPMFFDAVASVRGGVMSPEEGEKRSPDIDSSQEAGQFEAEIEGEADAKTEAKVEATDEPNTLFGANPSGKGSQVDAA